MARLHEKIVSAKPCWYLRETARVDAKPPMVSERWLGSLGDIEALRKVREAAVCRDRPVTSASGTSPLCGVCCSAST